MSLSRINKILIACRGEIACRIAKTAERLGIQTVAVYSDFDKDSLHVRMASEAHRILPISNRQNKSQAEQFINAAVCTNSQAIHPGYGTQPNDAELAAMCQRNGIIFIGPPGPVVNIMELKNICKHTLEGAGISVVKGYHGINQDDNLLLEKATQIGFPVMIKAVKGRGGKGMRVSSSDQDFFETLNLVRKESHEAFGNSKVFLEQFITSCRIIEVQIFGDSHGNYVHLCERDCSIQRHNTTVIAEAPCPFITKEIRKKIGKTAIQVAKIIGYIGAGTVKFIVDRNHDFYFVGLNTRLNCEHPLTEMITGFDLVEWQLRVAAGEKLPVIHQQLILPKGHAFQTRIRIESSSNSSLGGTLACMTLPTSSENVRIDLNVMQGDAISDESGGLIAKLIVWSFNRSSALQQLQIALRSFQIVGVPTNIEFLQTLSAHPEFIEGKFNSDFLNQHNDLLSLKCPIESLDFCRAAVALVLINDINNVGLTTGNENVSVLNLKSNDSQKTAVFIETDVEQNQYRVKCELESEKTWRISGSVHRDEVRHQILMNIDNDMVNIDVYKHGIEWHVFILGRHQIYTNCVDHVTEGCMVTFDVYQYGTCPMTGVIDQIYVKDGDTVKHGDTLLTVMAMKMEYSIRAACDGTVRVVHVNKGQTVEANANLFELIPDD